MIGLMTHAPTMSRLVAEMNVEHLRELQRFAEAGRISASLIHDMSSPLTAAMLHLEQEGSRGLAGMRHARRSIKILERYIEAARRQLCHQDQTAFFCVRHEICQTKYILQPLAKRQDVSIQFNICTGGQKLLGDPVKFQRIITNLVTNAIDSYRQTAASDIRQVKVTSALCRDSLVIRVEDQGKGITAEQLPHLFEPFYTTKEPGAVSGLGIGLSTVRQYVEEDFRGSVSVASSPDEGTEFRVSLPLGPVDDSFKSP